MKNFDFTEKEFQIYDSIDSYFECISSCNINKDGTCIYRCVETTKKCDN